MMQTRVVTGLEPRVVARWSAQEQLSLDEFELFIGSLQALWLPKNRFTERNFANGDVAYEFIFPSSLEEILSLQRRYGRKTSG